MAGIQSDWQPVERAVGADKGQHLRSGGAVSVIGDKQRVRSLGILARRFYQPEKIIVLRTSLRFAINAHHLLAAGVGASSQDPSLCDGAVSLELQDSAGRNMFLPEALQQQAAGLVVAHNPDGQNIYPQFGEVIDGIGPAAWNQGAIAMLENEHRGFARDAGNFPKNK